MTDQPPRTEFVRASQARIWRIVAVAILAFVAALLAWLAYLNNASTVRRLAADEKCLRSVVAAQSQRSDVLARLGKRRADADQARQNWNTVEQQVFADAFAHKGRPKLLEHRFRRANAHYLHADARYRRLNTLYNQAAQAHPVPRISCKDGDLRQPAPTVTASVTRTTTAPAPPPLTHTRVRTVVVPRTRVIVRHHVIVRTVTVAPGHRRHR